MKTNRRNLQALEQRNKEKIAEAGQISWLLVTSFGRRRKLESHHLAASMFDTFHVHL